MHCPLSHPFRRSIVSLVIIAAVGTLGGWYAIGTRSVGPAAAPSFASAIATAFPTAEAGFAAQDRLGRD